MLPDELILLAERVIAAYKFSGMRIVTAESCTGGLIAGCLTAIDGSSAVLERGYVTYSNLAKEQDLDVPAELLETHGAVSAETAEAMVKGALAKGALAKGALASSPADVAIAVTGIAGPGGGTRHKPVGLVYLGLACRGGGAPVVEKNIFPGDRTAIRRATVIRALELLLVAAGPKP
ncbi:MAG: CinA family protein [Rhodospirillaceae bacterium]